MAKADQQMYHPNSILAQAQFKGNRRLVNGILRDLRTRDIDLMLMNKWARAGFISIPGNLGPRDGDIDDDD